MASLKYVAQKFKEYSGRKQTVELTPERMRAFKSYLNYSLQIIKTNAQSADTYSDRELESMGELYFLFEQFFPKGNIPDELKGYSDFVYGIARNLKEDFSKVYETKLQNDWKAMKNALRGGDTSDDFDKPVWARNFVSVVELADIKPDKKRIKILYGGELLYEDDLPENYFKGLPQGSTLIFDYTEQGIIPNLEKTFEESFIATKNSSLLEQIVIESLARDTETKHYISELTDHINAELS